MEIWDILDEHGNKTGVTKVRGEKLEEGEYHLVVHVWTVNSKGEFLVSKRTPNKEWPLMWETQSGSAASGEDSLTAALKETREEVGIVLNPANGEYYCRVTRTDNICDVWIFRQDVELSDVVLQEGETCDAALMSGEKILQMIKEETFIGFEFYPYLLEMFEYLRKDLTR